MISGETYNHAYWICGYDFTRGFNTQGENDSYATQNPHKADFHARELLTNKMAQSKLSTNYKNIK